MIHALLLAALLSPPSPDYPALMKGMNVPGAQIVVVDRGKVVIDAAFGVKNLQSRAPVDVHTRFEIGSITKQFTAAAILQLKEHGKLSLDDKLGKYVPQYARGRDITLRQMLLQISGIPNYTDSKAFGALIQKRNGVMTLTKPGSVGGVIAMIAGKKLDFTPGTKWEYSNSNYYLLGRVVEVASGMPWRAYIAKNVFERAGMAESSFMENEAATPDMATGYTYDKKLRLIPGSSFNGWAGGAGTIVSTASDLAKWDAALFAGEIISPADVELMTSPGTLPALDKNSHYAFGWVIDTFDGRPRIWHNGGTMGFNSSNQIYPEDGQTVIVLTNSPIAADDLAQKTFDVLHPDYAAAKLKGAAGEDAAVTARIKSIWNGLAVGPIDRSQLSDTMNKHLTPEFLSEVKSQISVLGTPTSWVYKGKTSDKTSTNYTYYVTFSSGHSFDVVMTLDDAGKVSAYELAP
jgi:D-alanyl-D-alanine carboxypeptidase